MQNKDRIDDWHQIIDEVNAGFKQLNESLNIEQINTRPHEKGWSIAQIMDHLVVINSSYFPMLQALREGKFKPPFIAKFSPIAKFIGNSILRSVQPESPNKVRTFAIWEPSTVALLEDSFPKLETTSEIAKRRDPSLCRPSKEKSHYTISC